MQSLARHENPDDFCNAVGATRLRDFELPNTTGKGDGQLLAARNDARNELIVTHRHLARSIARTFHFSIGKGVALEDLVAYGDKGLVEAASRFDRTRGIPFGAFARRRIEGSIVDGIRVHSPLSRRAYERLRTDQARPANDTGSELFQTLDLSTNGDGHDWRAAMAEPGEARHDARWNGRRMAHLPVAEDDSLEVLVAAELRRLPTRERRLFRLCYYQGKTLTEAAHQMGRGCSWASRVHTKALATLRAAIEKQATGLSDRKADRSIESLRRTIRGRRSRRGRRIS
jgi:RNA polymerase sigma factor for flagellar operon FliA